MTPARWSRRRLLRLTAERALSAPTLYDDVVDADFKEVKRDA